MSVFAETFVEYYDNSTQLGVCTDKILWGSDKDACSIYFVCWYNLIYVHPIRSYTLKSVVLAAYNNLPSG